MFVVKVYCKIEPSPRALTLTGPVSEVFELPTSDWPEKNQQREAARRLFFFLHDIVFLIDRHNCVAHSTGKGSEQNVNNSEKLQALARLQETNTLQ